MDIHTPTHIYVIYIHVHMAHQAGVADAFAEGKRLLLRGEQLPGGLVDPNRVAERRELVAVLGLRTNKTNKNTH